MSHQCGAGPAVRANHGKANAKLFSGSLPWECEEGDHLETPSRAFEDIVPLLNIIAKKLGKSAPELMLYDPYYCDSATTRNLAELGFENVYNECRDFYADIANKDTPEFDVLLTNPPFGEEHVQRLFQFAQKSGKPWIVLLPNGIYRTQMFHREVGRRSKHHPPAHFLVSPKRYKFKSPRHLRPGRTNLQRRYTSPTYTFWHVGLGHLEKEWNDVTVKELNVAMKEASVRAAAASTRVDPMDTEVLGAGSSSGVASASAAPVPPESLCCVWAATIEDIPVYAQSTDKTTPLALFRKSFNDLCKQAGVGRVCTEDIFLGICKCQNSVPPSPFIHNRDTHLRQQFRTQVLTWMETNPIPDEWIHAPKGRWRLVGDQ